MKKRLILLFALLLCLPAAIQAQNSSVTDIQSLAVDLWPDYDQSSVLVLITGALSTDTALPATVTIPLPANTSLNAVARISDDNAMIDDIEFTPTDNSVTLTTPDARFRVEYYMPYEANGNDRVFTFSWMADVQVEQFEVSIQQPSGAGAINISPAPARSTVGSVDNLTYHVLPQTAVAAGELYEVMVDYTLTTPQLSVNLANQQQQTSPQTAVSPPAATTSNNLPLILGIVGGVLIVAVLGWALANNQKTTARPKKPRPRKTETPSRRSPKPDQTSVQPARFCHECGAGLQAGDKFCRECGTVVKAG